MKIGFPNDRRQRGATCHQIENGREVNGGFAADPLDVARALRFAPSNGVVEGIAGELDSATWIECIQLGDAKHAAEIAAGQIEKMRRNQVELFAIFHTMPKHARSSAGF